MCLHPLKFLLFGMWFLTVTIFSKTLIFSTLIILCISFLGCYKITTVFSHAQTVVLCVSCSTVLCQPTGGKARLTEGKCPLVISLGSNITKRQYVLH